MKAGAKEKGSKKNKVYEYRIRSELHLNTNEIRVVVKSCALCMFKTYDRIHRKLCVRWFVHFLHHRVPKMEKF